MKTIKTVKIMALSIITFAQLSCGNETDKKQVKEAMKDGVEILKEVPKIKKELKKTQKAIENATLDGELSMINGEEIMLLSTWDKNRSYIRYFDNKIVARASRGKDIGQSVAIKVNGKNLFGDQETIYKTMDLGINEGAYAEFTFYDTNKEGTGSPITATTGEFILSKIENGYFQIAYKGKGSIGKYEDKKEIDLAFSFYMDFGKALIKDNRTK